MFKKCVGWHTVKRTVGWKLLCFLNKGFMFLLCCVVFINFMPVNYVTSDILYSFIGMFEKCARWRTVKWIIDQELLCICKLSRFKPYSDIFINYLPVRLRYIWYTSSNSNLISIFSLIDADGHYGCQLGCRVSVVVTSKLVQIYYVAQFVLLSC